MSLIFVVVGVFVVFFLAIGIVLMVCSALPALLSRNAALSVYAVFSTAVMGLLIILVHLSSDGSLADRRAFLFGAFAASFVIFLPSKGVREAILRVIPLSRHVDEPEDDHR